MNGKVVIGTELDTKNFDEEIKQTEEKLNRLQQAYEKALNPPKGMKANEQALKELRLQIEQTSNKLVTLKKRQEQAHQKAPSNVLDWVKNFGKETEKNIKKISRWALALIGIRGVVSLISRSLNTLSQYDDQLSANVQYLRFAIATTLKPVIEYLVNLAFKLMSYIGYIAKAWFGINIFANASADAMNKTAKSAKEINKQLAGFDEMNVLSDTSKTDTGTGATLPSFDLSQQNIEPPKWLVWIGKHGKEIISIITGIAGSLALLKVGLSPLMAGGIGLAIAGIVYSIMAILDYLKDPSWENFGKIITGIGITVAGVAIAFGAWPVALAGAIVAVLGIIIKNWEKIKEFLQGGIDWLTSKSDWVRDMFGDQIGDIYDNIVFALQMVLNGFNNVFTGIKKIFDGIITFIKGVFTGNWQQAWEGVKQIFAGIFQSIFGYAQIIFGKIMAIAGSIALVIGQTISDLFKGVVNIAIGAIERILNKPISSINGIIKAGNKIPGVNISYLTPVKLPRLAKGGIINLPGRGVNYGGANIAERGMEGIIPLTDSQQMSLLGEAIGKYITINANITNTMNGRVISRELKKVQNDSDFAYNG